MIDTVRDPIWQPAYEWRVVAGRLQLSVACTPYRNWWTPELSSIAVWATFERVVLWAALGYVHE